MSIKAKLPRPGSANRATLIEQGKPLFRLLQLVAQKVAQRLRDHRDKAPLELQSADKETATCGDGEANTGQSNP